MNSRGKRLVYLATQKNIANANLNLCDPGDITVSKENNKILMENNTLACNYKHLEACSTVNRQKEIEHDNYYNLINSAEIIFSNEENNVNMLAENSPYVTDVAEYAVASGEKIFPNEFIKLDRTFRIQHSDKTARIELLQNIENHNYDLNNNAQTQILSICDANNFVELQNVNFDENIEGSYSVEVGNMQQFQTAEENEGQAEPSILEAEQVENMEQSQIAEENASNNGQVEEVENMQEADENEGRAEEIENVQEAEEDEDNQLTKKGNPRKRKKHSISKAERKKLKEVGVRENHKILPPCSQEKCRKGCISNISEERRVDINKQFWELNWFERRTFILNTASAVLVKKSTEGSKRKKTFNYTFKDEKGIIHKVCKPFFLSTLGYKTSNDWLVHNVLTTTNNNQLVPNPDRRGKHPSTKKIDPAQIKEHIETFNPCISHYRREHAPNVRYLPSDINITFMYNDFKNKNPTFKCSYDLYRTVLKNMKINFTKLGHEECEQCEEFKLHSNNHTKDNLEETCVPCQAWGKHINKAQASRENYKKDSESTCDSKTICVSVDLQKVIMLPRIDTFKRVVFTKRIVAYNESFVPVGKRTNNKKPYATIWHEGISGRNKTDLISTFYAFILKNRDAKKICFWLDNCASQNKNWCLLSFLVYVCNSGVTDVEEIIFNYFEPGHTFMSADSFHHQVELSLKKQGKTYDFSDFSEAVSTANASHVDVKEMQFADFFEWTDFSSIYKINKSSPRPYLSDIVQIKALKGKHVLFYKTSFAADFIELDFINKKNMKKGEMSAPKPHNKNCGISAEKKRNILNNLGTIIPLNRKQFWQNLTESDV